MHALTSLFSQRIGLLLLRVTTAGLIFWWGLVKGLNTGAGTAVSNKYYGGMFSQETLLILFGWAQVLLAVLVALGLFRVFTLPLQLLINAFVAVAIWQSFVDPFWLWMAGDKPETLNALFYPSIIVVAACWVLIAFRHHDTIALDALRRT
ncbi:MAG: hypothetical protein AAGH83_10750 [Pseudomonadota bacterium]